MSFRTFIALLALGVPSLYPSASPAANPPYKPVAEIMEDDAEGLLKHLESQDRGQGLTETTDVYSGKVSIKIIPMQRFARNIPGWAFRITENPKPGEYRFVRFAWKADSATKGIMLQMHDEKDWNIRFTAGIDAYNWGTKFVAQTPPTQWTVVTRDLFKEFGERTIRGMALTVFEGQAGYFDHIYFGRTIEDLDRIDATGQSDGPAPVLKDEELEQLWRELGGADAAKAYRAFWTLVAAAEQSTPFLKRALAWSNDPSAMKQIKRWMRELEGGDYEAREEASKQLIDHLDAAAPLLKKVLAAESMGLEGRLRIGKILGAVEGDAPGMRRVEEAVRVLDYAKIPAAKLVLKELAGGDENMAVTRAAKARLERIGSKN